jgi:hypothetical protein
MMETTMKDFLATVAPLATISTAFAVPVLVKQYLYDAVVTVSARDFLALQQWGVRAMGIL